MAVLIPGGYTATCLFHGSLWQPVISGEVNSNMVIPGGGHYGSLLIPETQFGSILIQGGFLAAC